VDGGATEVSLSYAELDRQARAIGTELQRLKAGGERGLLLYPPGLDYIAAFFGCLYAGTIAVPTYPPLMARLDRTLPKLQAIASSAQPTVVLTTPAIRSMVEPICARAPEFQQLRWLTTDTNDIALAEQRCDPAVNGDTLAILQYTSGSTSAPKGVMVSHGNLIYNQRMICRAFRQTEQSIVVGWLPLYHDMGLIGNVLQPLYLGARCILMSPMAFLQQPFRWLQAVSRYKASTSGGPNFAYDLCTRKTTPEQRATLDLSSWIVAFNGAEPVRAETMERFAATFAECGFRPEAFYPCYGLAETTLFVAGGATTAPPVTRAVQGPALAHSHISTASAGCADIRTLVGCGQTWLDQTIAIVDPVSATRCPPDRVGEVWVSGPNVAQGYWKQAAETERAFRAFLADTGEGPFLRTGDLGFLQDGELFITGRLKDLIVTNGQNHYPQDIEQTIEQHVPMVRPGCCAAFSVDIDGVERLVVAAELDQQYKPRQRQVAGASDSDAEDPAALDIDALIRAIRRVISEQHDLQIHDVVLLKGGSIPKTSSGKIQRYACRAGFLTQSLDMWGG
jgi:acyl-CoA synthetase (AMP-forming)/AMP-acid ligase II